MECGESLQSFEAIVRTVTEYAEGSGCGNVRTSNDSIRFEFECDTNNEGDLTVLARTLDTESLTIRVDAENVSLANLCATYERRVDCDFPPSLATMMREAMGYNGDAGDLVFRVVRVSDVTIECGEECEEHSLLTRMASTFVKQGDRTFILVVRETPGEALTCDNAEVSPLTILGGVLMPIGSCNMWAWKVSLP